MVFVHDISPIMFSLGPISVRWYGALFATGLALNYMLIRWAFKKRKYDLKKLDSVVFYLFFGLVIGARMGEVLFYEPAYFFSHPLDIVKIWQGGLSSHGAAIGLFVAYLIWCKVHKVKFSKYIDTLVIGMPLTAAFVRIGNFFNSEILGTETNGGYGVVFARKGEIITRHPVQLYSAFMNLVIFAVIFFLFKKYYKKMPPMFFLFLYLAMYFIGRFVVEFWKDLHTLPEAFPLSMGQLLSLLPIAVAGFYFAKIYPKQR